jgi:hypothetical protein
MLIGVDYHPSFQQIAFLVEETGDDSERRLNRSDGEAEKFYRDLKRQGAYVRVGMEATGYSRWFERLLAELDFEVWIGDPAEIKAKRVKKQKFDREEAQLILRLMRENNFPQIWVPGPENRDRVGEQPHKITDLFIFRPSPPCVAHANMSPMGESQFNAFKHFPRKLRRRTNIFRPISSFR